MARSSAISMDQSRITNRARICKESERRKTMLGRPPGRPWSNHRPNRSTIMLGSFFVLLSGTSMDNIRSKHMIHQNKCSCSARNSVWYGSAALGSMEHPACTTTMTLHRFHVDISKGDWGIKNRSAKDVTAERTTLPLALVIPPLCICVCACPRCLLIHGQF